MKRKQKRNKWRNARNRLLRLAATKPVFPEVAPGKLVFGEIHPGAFPKELDPELEKLRGLLRLAAGDADVWSLVLQCFLASMGMDWPDGVFTCDFALPESGRPLSRLSINSWHLYQRSAFGNRRVAKELIPEEYENDPDEAANRVRKAARSFIAFRKSILAAIFSNRPQIQERIRELLWPDGLDALAWKVIERKFMDALSEPAYHGHAGKGRRR